MKITSYSLAAFFSVWLLNLGLPLPVYSNDAGTSHWRQSSADPSKSVRQLYEQYKSLDLTNNPQIINLYANDAVIDVLGTRYNKTSYGRFVAASYQNPASGLNTHTVYGQPNIRVTNNSAQLTFAAVLGPSSMNVFWNLRRSPSGVWQIISEQFTRSAPAVSAVRGSSGTPSSKMGFGSPNLNDGIRQMNENPDTKAFVDRFKKLREQQQQH